MSGMDRRIQTLSHQRPEHSQVWTRCKSYVSFDHRIESMHTVMVPLARNALLPHYVTVPHVQAWLDEYSNIRESEEYFRTVLGNSNISNICCSLTKFSPAMFQTVVMTNSYTNKFSWVHYPSKILSHENCHAHGKYTFRTTIWDSQLWLIQNAPA